MSWSLKDFFFNRRRDELAVGQVRRLTKLLNEENPIEGLEIGDKVIIKGPGEYGGYDVAILLPNGKYMDIGARQLLDASEPLDD